VNERAAIPFGRYELLHPIGCGGMAEVWKARLLGARSFAKTVVVKRILPHLGRNPEFAAMFTAEALLLARLDHPDIVSVIEFSSAGDELFIAMEYLEGVNLLDVMKRVRPLPIGLVAYVVRAMCRALAYAHAVTDDDGRPLGLIHRDVSPTNVMVTLDGRVKLLDFGIAKAVHGTDETTRSGALKGKLSYLSPEAVAGDVDLDARSDIFSTGVVLHELLCGERLFKSSGHELAVLEKVRACAIDPPSMTRAEVGPELDAICMRAVARDRDERYAKADDFASDLTSFLKTTPWDVEDTVRFFAQHGIGVTPPHADPAPTVSGRPGSSDVRVPRRRWALYLVPAIAVAAVGGAVAGMRGGARPATPVTSSAPPPRAELAAPTIEASPPPSVPPAAQPLPAAAAKNVAPSRRTHRRTGSRGVEKKVDLMRGDVFDGEAP
jgi:serine/threonine protein kinase